MDFYRINEEYNKFLQVYEKEKRGITKVPNIRYADRNKFAFGVVSVGVQGATHLKLCNFGHLPNVLSLCAPTLRKGV